MKRLKLFWKILTETGASSLLLSYVVFVFIDAALITLTEPTFTTYKQGLWYCYAVISTAGFGDLVVTTLLPRVLSVILTIYSTLVIAITTGVIVNYYSTVTNIKNKETLDSFMDRLENLPDLSKDELREMAQQVKKFRAGHGNGSL